MAALAISNIVKTSLGPVGLDKMLVDDVGVSQEAHWIFRDLGIICGGLYEWCLRPMCMNRMLQ